MIDVRCISAPRSWSHKNNTIVLTILTLQYIQYLHLMYTEVAWVLVSSGTQVQPQITTRLSFRFLLQYFHLATVTNRS